MAFSTGTAFFRCRILPSITSRLLTTRSSDGLTNLNITDGVGRITLNNPVKRNALSLSMLDELRDRFREVANDTSVQAVILDHIGEVFSAGHDLKELTASSGRDVHVKIFQRCTQVMNLIQDIPVPVIAEVNGVATAAGCQLVATCDLAIASRKSTFAVPGVSIGLFCSTPAVALSRSVSRKRALQMLLTGDPITAQEALESGLVNQVVEERHLYEASELLASRITRHSGHVIGIGKQAFYKQIKQDRDAAYCLAENVMVDNLQHADAQEGISSFFQKRTPTWTKR